MIEKFSRNYMIGTAYVDVSRKKTAEISEDQYKIIENIYQNKLSQIPLIKIPEDNSHVKVKLNKKLPQKTLTYPADREFKSGFKSYLLTRPDSPIHKIMSIK